MRATLFLTLALIFSACSPATEPPPTPQPEPSATPLVMVEPSATPFSPEATNTTPPEIAPTATEPGPTCTVLQDLNLRSGPGTAYRPPLRVFPKDTVVTPSGFNPTGIPGGSWVFVTDPSDGQQGWVSAGSQYVNCDLDLASLPAIAVGTPIPPPLPRSAISSTPEGSCADEGVEYVCEVVFSDEAWIQFKILQNGQELGQEAGVENVTFEVLDQNGNGVYNITEQAKDYCIFGGNGPCNPWVVENYGYRWQAGGSAVQPGVYLVNIQANVNGTLLTWHANFTVSLP